MADWTQAFPTGYPSVGRTVMNEDTHVDSNVPGNPAYHFSVVTPGTPVSAGWTQRTSLLGSAQIGTMCVHAGALPDPAYGSVAPPIYQTSTFAFNDLCTNAGYKPRYSDWSSSLGWQGDRVEGPAVDFQSQGRETTDQNLPIQPTLTSPPRPARSTLPASPRSGRPCWP